MDYTRSYSHWAGFYQAAYYREMNNRILLQILVCVLLVIIAILFVIASRPATNHQPAQETITCT